MVVNIAKNIITLSAINDAFSVSFSPNTCVIKADYDGNNPLLNSAYTDVSLKRGEKKAKYELTYKTSSNSGIAYKISTIDEYTKRILLTAIPNNVVSGYLIFDIESDEGYNSTITFQFSVIRESTMLDWIQDWENNKTTIGSTYLITPKIFVGKKVVNEAGLNSLTGVYIGPDAASAGIYGYKEGEDIFHINENGGNIGGWEIDTKGIQSSDRLFKILSEGTIKVEDNSGEIIWAIQKGGDATFSKGKVRLNGDGSAYFEGNITSISGNIGGWSLGENLLRSDYLVLDSSRHYIGISPFDLSTLEEIDNAFNHKSYVKEKGGVCMFYTSANSYGIEGYLPVAAHSDEARQVFSLGSTNQISGWNMSEKKLASTHVVLVSDDIASGIYMSTTDISQTSPSNLVGAIENSSGIYLYSTEHEAKFVGMKTSGVVFSLSSTTDSIIAGWKFNDTAIFKGTLTTSGFTQSSGDITISSEGLSGHKWRLDADGNGAIANGEIYWDTDGVHFGENVKLSWNNFSDEAKDDMQNGLLPDWVNDWDKVENKTEIGGEYIVSPKFFSGTRDQGTGKLTGIAFGRDCLTDNDGMKRTGIFALVDDEIVFELDPINKKNKFTGTFLAKVDDNNVWEVNNICENIIGNKEGKRIVISPNSQDIKIYDEDNNNVSVIEGVKKNTLADVFNNDLPPVVSVLNLPFSLPFGQRRAGACIVSSFYTDGVLHLNCSFKAKYLSLISFTNKIAISIISKNYADESLTEYIDSTVIYNESITTTGKEWDVNNISVILNKGYHYIDAYLQVDKNISDGFFHISSANFSFVKDLYVSTYFANGLVLGTSTDNMFAFINTKDESNTNIITGQFANTKYGIELAGQNIKVKRDGHWGIMPSIVACGRIRYGASESAFEKIYSFDNSIPELSIDNMGKLFLKMPQSWRNANVNSDTCYISITPCNMYVAYSVVNIGIWDDSYIYFDIYNSNGSTNTANFFFEIKRY